MHVSYIYLITFAFSVAMGFILLPRIVRVADEKNLYDLPDSRRVHKTPTPRLGGISFLPVAIMSIFLFNVLSVHFLGARIAPENTLHFMRFQSCAIGAFLLYMVGITDDMVGVDYRWKFAVQIAVSTLFPLSGLTLHNIFSIFWLDSLPAVFDYALTMFVVVYIINAINLIDGVDGLAAGICIITFTLFACIFFYLRHAFMVATCLSILGVLIVFFVFNIFGGGSHKMKKLFMGDTGSYTLGYFICFLLLYIASYRNITAMGFIRIFDLAVSPLVIPMLDIIRVVWARYRDRVPLFKADKRHIHHKLLRTGLSPLGTMVTMLLLTLMFIGLDIAAPLYLKTRWVILSNIALWVLMHLVINYFIRKREARLPEGSYAMHNQKNTISEGKRFEL